MSTDSTQYLEQLAAWRAQRDDFLANHYATPLSDEALSEFIGLAYFPVDPDMVFRTPLLIDVESVPIESSAGSVSDYPAAGFVELALEDGVAKMRVLKGEEDELFIPFRDTTCGVTTYSGGRYVLAEPQVGRVVTVDFNKATNPYCAYDPDFSCPLPPAENRLGFPIEAGELNW